MISNKKLSGLARCEYLETKDKSVCYGCGACEAGCPAGAITMRQDEKGFFYPAVEEKKCTGCGRCRNICIYRKEQKKRYRHTLYAVQNKSVEVLEHCQSGGIFDAFSDVILEGGGRVYGSVICDGLDVRHVGTDNKNVRDKMRGSKYVKSHIPDGCFRRMGMELKSGRQLLFTGTPCQCAAVNALYGAYENLYTLEFICHGTPSHRLYRDYIAWFEKEMAVQIKTLFFRIQNWKSEGLHTMLLEDTQGQQYFNSDYSALFYSHLGHRESCLRCGFANKNRQADLTMGGFLDKGIFECFGNKYGVSMCILNSEKGRQLFYQAKGKIGLQEVGYGGNYFRQQPCLYHPVGEPKNYNRFWEEYLANGYKSAVEKYVPQRLYGQYHLVNHGGVILLPNLVEI